MTGQRTVQWHRVRMLNSPGVSGPLGREFCVLEPPAGGVLRAPLPAAGSTMWHAGGRKAVNSPTTAVSVVFLWACGIPA